MKKLTLIFSIFLSGCTVSSTIVNIADNPYENFIGTSVDVQSGGENGAAAGKEAEDRALRKAAAMLDFIYSGKDGGGPDDLNLLFRRHTAAVQKIDGVYVEFITAEVNKSYARDYFLKGVTDVYRLGNPVLGVSIKGEDAAIAGYASEKLKDILRDSGYIIPDGAEKPALKIEGLIKLSPFPLKDGSGMIRYRASLHLKAVSPDGKNAGELDSTMPGIDTGDEGAAEAAAANAVRTSADDIGEMIKEELRSRNMVRLQVYNVKNLTELYDFMKKLRAIKGVRAAWTLDYNCITAYVDVAMSKGRSADLARGLIEAFGVKLKVNRSAANELEVAIPFSGR